MIFWLYSKLKMISFWNLLIMFFKTLFLRTLCFPPIFENSKIAKMRHLLGNRWQSYHKKISFDHYVLNVCPSDIPKYNQLKLKMIKTIISSTLSKKQCKECTHFWKTTQPTSHRSVSFVTLIAWLIWSGRDSYVCLITRGHDSYLIQGLGRYSPLLKYTPCSVVYCRCRRFKTGCLKLCVVFILPILYSYK